MHKILKHIVLFFFLVSCNLEERILTDDELDAAFAKVNNHKLWDELKERVQKDQESRHDLERLDKKAPDYQDQKKAIWNKLEVIDNDNTKWMIDFTEKYGFPDPDRTCKPIAAWVIFQHSREKFWDELKPLIEREYKAKRINRPTYIMYRWHLNGRKGTIDDMEIEIIKKERGLNF